LHADRPCELGLGLAYLKSGSEFLRLQGMGSCF
jgi:hypothetical protein